MVCAMCPTFYILGFAITLRHLAVIPHKSPFKVKVLVQNDMVIILICAIGAFSVAGHIASPLSAGLFSKAIMQSVPIMLPYRTLPSATKLGTEFARVVCSY